MSLEELREQNIRLVTDKALECFIKNGISNTKVSEIAAAAGSFNYEFACGISRRVPRVYLRGGQAVHTVHYLTDVFQEEPHGT